jgi:hypothetical protein
MFFKSLKLIDRIILFNLLGKINIRVKKFFVNRFCTNNKDFKNISFLNNNKILLSELSEKYGSDKGYTDINKKRPFLWKPHSYTNLYNNLFGHCRNQIKLVFECGIGTNKDIYKSNMSSTGQPGASLKMWRDYFPNAMIFGADIDKDILFNDQRITTFYVDQLNSDSIKEMWGKINLNNFDIIIDDGMHTFESSRNFFLNSFDMLKEGGIYIIEDVDYKDFKNYSEEFSNLSLEQIMLQDEKSQRHTNNLCIIRK